MTNRNVVRAAAVAGLAGLAFAAAPSVASAQTGTGSLGQLEESGIGSVVGSLDQGGLTTSLEGVIGEDGALGSITSESLTGFGGAILDAGSVNSTLKSFGSLGGSVGTGSDALNTDGDEGAGESITGSLDAGSTGLVSGSKAADENEGSVSGSLSKIFVLLGAPAAGDDGEG